MRLGWWMGLIVVVVGLGCGEDTEKANQDQESDELEIPSLNIELKGAVERSISWGEDDHCSSTGPTDYVLLQYFGDMLVDTEEQIHLRIEGIVHGEEASGLDAWVSYHDEEDNEWRAEECTVEITTNEEVAEDTGDLTRYLIVGSGHCTDDGELVGQDNEQAEPIEFGPFEFACRALWTKQQ